MIRFSTSLMIQRFTAQWGEPKTPNMAMFLDEYERALKNTDPELLRAATDACIDSETYWPKVAVVKSHIDKISIRMATLNRLANPEIAPEHKNPSAESRARVAALVAKTAGRLRTMGSGTR